MAWKLLWFVFVLSNLSFVEIIFAKCKGRTILKDINGTITDGLETKYPSQALCEWLIEAQLPSQSITLTFTSFATECSFDFLFIHDGPSYASPVIATFTGDTLPDSVVARSGAMLISLYSDTNYVLKGFVANYVIENCTEECSSNGVCKNGQCQCRRNWKGPSCNIEDCPSNCNFFLQYGICNYVEGYCVCKEGFTGESCSLSLHTDSGDNSWYKMVSFSAVFRPRFAHAAVYIESYDTLWVFGGYSLNLLFDDLLKYNFSTNQWSIVNARSGSTKPSARYSHTATHFKDSILIFGGELVSGQLTNELWLFNITTSRWKLLAENDAISPYPVASHSANLVDDKLFIYGGRTANVTATSAMFSYDLSSGDGWKRVNYKGGKDAQYCSSGHTSVYYAPSRSLIVFGGFYPHTVRSSSRTSDLHIFHIDELVWSKAVTSGPSPKPRSFHSATIIGDYMVVYGGYIHNHYNDETCYSNKVYYYHLVCHKWVPSSVFDVLSPAPPSPVNPRRGRFSHAVVVKGTSMLVIGGYSGAPIGTMLAYKVPKAVAAVNISGTNFTGGHCGEYRIKINCIGDPACGWCKDDGGKCLRARNRAICSSSFEQGACLGSCGTHAQCTPCILWSKSHPSGCGWCVQDSRCYPRDAVDVACSSITKLKGWWGSQGQFLTTVDECRTKDFPPGLTVTWYETPENYSQPDGVFHVSISRAFFPNHVKKLFTSRIRMRMSGFIYPFILESPLTTKYRLRLKLSGARTGAGTGISYPGELYLGTSEAVNTEEQVATATQRALLEWESSDAVRSGMSALFPSPQRNKCYYIKTDSVLGYRGKENVGGWSTSILWNGTNTNFWEIPSPYLRPFHLGNCSALHNCLACMTDASCGWCDATATCVPRSSSSSCNGHQQSLVLNATECRVCDDYLDCYLCTKDSQCAWYSSGLFCKRRGIPVDPKYVVTDPNECKIPCASRQTCDSCLADTNMACAWCDSTRSCFSFGSYNSRYTYGQCTHWIDSNSSMSKLKCPNCSAHTNCTDCLANHKCGWCNSVDDPRVGRCYSGGFSEPLQGSCSVVFPFNGSVSWSYARCPDLDECQLGIDNCHPNANCVNFYGSYNCTCKRGFAGDGKSYCNKTCYHECVHGHCGPDLNCTCDLGWLGVNCTIDCGCNGHSSCSRGIGICDHCQDYTHGNHCEICVQGSYGDATTSHGCKPCACNGHGREDLGLCDSRTGKCFCKDNTDGNNCEVCLPGLVGNPRNGGKCYYECTGRDILTNVTIGDISSNERSKVNKPQSCLWLISSSMNSSRNVTYSMSPLTDFSGSTVTFTFTELNLNCLFEHVDVYDGIPPFILSGPAVSPLPFYKVGSYCGQGLPVVKSVEARRGNIVILFDGKQGHFSGRFTINRCPDFCTGNRHCVFGTKGKQECVCQKGWRGAACDTVVCPTSQGQGHCNKTSGSCEFSSGFIGADCNSTVLPRKKLWKLLAVAEPSDNNPSSLPRMGHAMVADTSTLYVFGGLSMAYGPLNDVWKCNVSIGTWEKINTNQVSSDVPSGRYYHSAVLFQTTLLVFGGITSTGVVNDVWRLNISSLTWTNLKVHEPRLALAGHSASLSLLDGIMTVIGGYHPALGFNSNVWQYNILKAEWSIMNTNVPPPAGLYGHTAVYHVTTESIFVFGGYQYKNGIVRESGDLYSLHLPSRSWNFLQALPNNKPKPKLFHAAVVLEDNMIVYGGGSDDSEDAFSRELLVYKINCNYWHTLTASDGEILGSWPEGLLSGSAVVLQDKAYFFGGFSGQTVSSLLELTLPSDLCVSITNKSLCVEAPGCSWCELSAVSGNPTSSGACFALSSQIPALCTPQFNVSRIVFQNGSLCESAASGNRSCSSYQSCSACLVTYPNENSFIRKCKWCDGCSRGGKCVAFHQSCDESNPCGGEVQQAKIHTNSCSYGAGCEKENKCAISCGTITNCSLCLESKGDNSGWKQCMWSNSLGQCLSSSYLPAKCLPGLCGQVVHQSTLSTKCWEPCVKHTHCSSCMRQPNCGWCADPDSNGVGVCMEGGLEGPLNGICKGTVINAGYHIDTVKRSSLITTSPPVWASILCPLENECSNQRHNCTPEQECIDRPNGFQCVCLPGYREGNRNAGEKEPCVPVCHQGCDNGECVKPDVCNCTFGYTSSNCSVQCHCNGHGQCANETALDVCSDCRNHTTGNQCQYCQPLYVGKAGSCISCFNACNRSANVCMDKKNLTYARNRSLSLDPKQVKLWLHHGPSQIDEDEECLCLNFSKGIQCKKCQKGYFFLDSYCTKCMCNGHGDECNLLGRNCNCHNNTEEDCAGPIKECYKNQCTKCKEQYKGKPANRRQCYRKMTYNQVVVIGQEAGAWGSEDITPLLRDRSLFYAVFPRFTNVDIRMTVDVFDGGVDVYITTDNSLFAIDVNKTTGVHTIQVEGLNHGRVKRSPETTSTEPLIKKHFTYAGDKLNTFVRFLDVEAVNIIKDLRNRLVVTFPHMDHSLRDTRFYICFLGRGESGTTGILYFKQDLPQIDLFVFFSVFFSVFFLVLSVCVIGWKIKQYHEQRRLIEMREREREQRASRPFATYSLLCDADRLVPSVWKLKRNERGSAPYKRELRRRKSNFLLRDNKERLVVFPVAAEPTEDSRANVVTVLFQLPKNEVSDLQLLFGSTLTTFSGQQAISSSFVRSSLRGNKSTTRRLWTVTS